MSFVSLAYVLLLSGCVILCLAAPLRFRNILLLCFSYVFYGWFDWRLAFLLLAVTVVTHAAGRALGREGHRTAPILWSALGILLGLLCFFKYAGFAAQNARHVLAALGMQAALPGLEIVLPIGISFYTFQAMAYLVDIRRGDVPPPGGLAETALFLSFFPQLVSGPIERASNLLVQIRTPRRTTPETFAAGLELLLAGFFKKMVLADNLAAVADPVFNAPAASGGEIAVATLAFTFQIYCDFSGYVDIARGSARMLGFELLENFRLPYFAPNPREFWRRWNMTLSNWFRDYVYIPLGGNRGGPAATLRNLMVTMALCGLWHGASWNYVLWGLYHGLLLAGHRLVRGADPLPSQGPRRVDLKGALLFFPFMSLGWLLFRIQDPGRLTGALASLFSPSRWSGLPVHDLALTLALAVPLMLFQAMQTQRGMEPWRGWPAFLRAAFFLMLGYGILHFRAEQTNAFIYFQF